MSFPPLIDRGPNADLVNEVVSFAFSDRVFSAAGPDEQRPSLLIISDMRRAVDAAGGVEPEGIIRCDETSLPWSAGPRVDDELLECTWTDLRQNLTALHIHAKGGYEWSERHEAELHTIRSMAIKWRGDTRVPLVEHFLRRLPEGPSGPDGSAGYYRTYIADEAPVDLMLCAHNRAFNGLTDNFWESLFQAYKAGLWPCGWHGTWPAPGVLIAWRRPSAI